MKTPRTKLLPPFHTHPIGSLPRPLVVRNLLAHNDDELCRAGMFHSIYGTQQFQGFKLELDKRDEVSKLIGERAEFLAYLNCAMQRETFDAAVERGTAPFTFTDRITKEEVTLDQRDFDDLCRIHLYDWLEQAPRSRYGWDYRRRPYRNLADRLGPTAQAAYDRIFALEPKPE